MNRKKMLCILSIFLVVGIAVVSFAFLMQTEAKVRKIEYAVIKPCDDKLAHFKIKDGKVQQVNSIATVIEGIEEHDQNGKKLEFWERFNKQTIYISIDSWDVKDWELGAWVLMGINYKTKQYYINPYSVGLLEQWVTVGEDCTIGYGPWTCALMNLYIYWINNNSPPSAEEITKKIGVIN